MADDQLSSRDDSRVPAEPAMAPTVGAAAPKRRLEFISVGDLIAVLAGLTLLIACWRFPEVLEGQGPILHGACLLIGAGLVLWGFRRLPFALSGRSRRPQRRGVYGHRVLIPREGLVCVVVMLVLAAGALVGHSNMLMLVFAMVAGPFVMNGWIVFSMLQRTRVSRTLPRTAVVGDRVSVQVTFENRKLMLSSRLMMVRDRIRNEREDFESSVLFTRVPPRSERRAVYRVQLANRGRYVFGPLYLSSRYPLGLGERGRIFDALGEILVRPRVGRIAAAWKERGRHATELLERQRSQRGSFDDDFHSIREFRSGDNTRAVHWKTTARKGQLMVREFRQTRDFALALLLDLWLPQKPAPDDLERLELIISFAATLFTENSRESRNFRFGVYLSGERHESVDGFLNPGATEVVLDRLAVVSGGPAASVSELFEQSSALRNGGARCVLLTTRAKQLIRDDGMLLADMDEHLHAGPEHVEVIGSDTEKFAQMFDPGVPSFVGTGFGNRADPAPSGSHDPARK